MPSGEDPRCGSEGRITKPQELTLKPSWLSAISAVYVCLAVSSMDLPQRTDCTFNSFLLYCIMSIRYVLLIFAAVDTWWNLVLVMCPTLWVCHCFDSDYWRVMNSTFSQWWGSSLVFNLRKVSSLSICISCCERSLNAMLNKAVKGSGRSACSSVSELDDAVSVSLFSRLVSIAASGAKIRNSSISLSVNYGNGETIITTHNDLMHKHFFCLFLWPYFQIQRLIWMNDWLNERISFLVSFVITKG